MAKALNHCQFHLLLDEVGRGRGGLVRGPPEYPSAVAAEVLKRFAVCLKEVKTFLGSKELTFPELEQPEYLEKLHFMVYMTEHLKRLNTTEYKGERRHSPADAEVRFRHLNAS